MGVLYPQLSEFEKSALLEDLKRRCGEGWEQLEEEISWMRIQEAINAVNGDHRGIPSQTLSKTYTNRTRVAAKSISSILTDVRPLFTYETANQEQKKTGEVLNKSGRFWWRAQKVDRVLSNVLDFSGVGASGYLMLTWDKDLQDIKPEAVDPRDVIPIEPVLGTNSVQEWRGVCIRKRIPLTEAKLQYPEFADTFVEQAGNSWFGPEVTRASGGVRKLVSNFWNAVASRRRRFDPPGVEIMRIYVKDSSINDTNEVMRMGEVDTNWYYEVPPGKPIWPRGKLVICTSDYILKVMPNPYWHAKFPLIKFTLVDAPWSLLGLSIIQDVLTLQTSLNESVRGLDDARNKILRPDVIADKRAISSTELRKIDSRMPGGQHHVDVTLTGTDGFKFSPPPDLGNYYLNYLAWLKDEIDDDCYLKGIQAFQQLKQMPSHDTIQEFLNAMTPGLKGMARNLEVAVEELAELMKFNFFQFYSADKRTEMLGAVDGVADVDFDKDPGSLVPEGDGTRFERASKVAKQFRFTVAPNTFLNISNIGDRMMKLQLWRGGGYPLWDLWGAFDIPERGPAPGETLPERMAAERRLGILPGPPPELVHAQLMGAMAQATAAMAQMGMQGLAPNAGPAPAAQPGQQGPGRPPSGNEPPKIETKDGGARQTVVES